MEKTSRSKIDTIDDFHQEFPALLKNIDANIHNLAQYERTEMEKPSVALVEKLNVLKIHSKKLRDMIGLYGEITEEEWETIRPEAQRIFQAAQDQYLKTNEDITAN